MKNRKAKYRLYQLWRLRRPSRWTAEDLVMGRRFYFGSEDRIWDSMAPVGSEFGSPDDERLMELDNSEYDAQIKVTLGDDRGVWFDIKDTPEEAEIMVRRSFYMIAISEYIKKNGLSTADTAKLFGLTQSRINSLMKGKINLFMLSSLEEMGLKVGISY